MRVVWLLVFLYYEKNGTVTARTVRLLYWSFLRYPYAPLQHLKPSPRICTKPTTYTSLQFTISLIPCPSVLLAIFDI